MEFYVFLFIISAKVQYIIGIDCGATGSNAVISPCIYHLKPKEIPPKEFSKLRKMPIMPQRFPPVNFNVLGFNKSAERIINIIKRISDGYGMKNIALVVAGVSGARYEKDRSALAGFISRQTKIKKVNILPDTEIALTSVFEPGKTNCGILIAGTGSILYYKDSKGKTKSIGGWGRYFGDEGSGYWIARAALSAVTKNYDNRGKKTILNRLAESNFRLNNESIIPMVYHEGFDISKAARLVFRAAEKGDRLSREIIKSAARELAEHFKPLKSKKYNIALTGSLFSEEKLLEAELKKIVKSKYPNINLIKHSYKPVWGAVKIANREIGFLKLKQ